MTKARKWWAIPAMGIIRNESDILKLPEKAFEGHEKVIVIEASAYITAVNALWEIIKTTNSGTHHFNTAHDVLIELGEIE